MDSEKTDPLTLMDKIRIVVEYKELKENEKAAYLAKNGINQKKLESYQKEAAAVVGGTQQPEPPKTRCEELIEQLESDNEDARREAAKELGQMRFRATSAVNALIDRALNDQIDFVKAWSSWALTRIEPRNPAVIEGFLKCVATEEHAVNARSWSMLGLSVSDSDYAQDQLLQILQTGKPFAQASAIKVLQDIGVKSAEFIEALKSASDSEDTALQKRANEALSKFQPGPED